MSATLRRRLDPSPLLRSAPIALPQVLAIVALVTLCAAEGGFPLEHWGPAGVLIGLLLLVALFTLPLRGPKPGGSGLAIGCVVLFAVWTGASLLWADDQGAAAIATTRTALLAATFVLFARWRHTPRTALGVLTVLTAGLGVLTWAAVYQLETATDLDPWFLYDRLLEPVGYVNAGAAFWGMAAFLGVGLVSSGSAPAPRLIGAAVAVPAAALSLLCLSRGGVLAAGIVAVLLLALLPGRARNATAFVVVALGLLVGLPALLDVGDAVRNSTDAASILHRALVRVIVGTVLAVLATAVWIAVERAVPRGDQTRERAARFGGLAVAAAGALMLAVSLAGVGPLTLDKVRDTASTITKPYVQEETANGRLSGGLNSGRWDFWTVAWDQYQAAPIVGEGADNFRQDYLLRGTSPENPRYPHSMWLRSLGQLGLVGTVLLLGWILTVLVAIRRLGATGDPAARAVALAAGGAFGLWVLHGSVDWLMEYGGLSAIAAAVAGLAVAAGPASRRTKAEAATGALGARYRRRGMLAAGAALLVVSVVWTSAQWVAERDRYAALAIAIDRPQRAVDRAERARTLDPFGERADIVLAVLALERGDLTAARAAYGDAYERNPRAASPRMWLGVLASAAGDQRDARRWLRRAARAAPRDALIADLSARVAQGQQLNPAAVQDLIAYRAAGLVRDPDPGDETSEERIVGPPPAPEQMGPPLSGR